MQAATGGPFGDQFHVEGGEEGDEVVEYLVGEGFVKDAGVAEGLEVEFVGFEFEAEGGLGCSGGGWWRSRAGR